jgi:uncharacterized membrane protein
VKQRYYLLDAFRGFFLVAMIVYHALWDLVNVASVSLPWFTSYGGFVAQRAIRWSFILLAGFCVGMSRKPAKRGVGLLLCSAVVTGVSYLVGSPILFGVLTFLGAASLLAALWKKLAGHRKPRLWLSWASFAMCLGLFLVTVHMENGKILGYSLPKWLYANDLTAFLGFPPEGFCSEDYVPLIPWVFAYSMGYHLYRIFARCNWLTIFSKARIRPLEWIGQHSLLLYLVHQPVLYGLVWLLF